MNERIRELWSQTVRNYGHSGQETCAQQFAELIVRECISVLQNVPNGYRDYRNQIEDADRRYCISHIKEHFGVEDPPVDNVDRILRTVRTRVGKS
jgi:hypothetical protein